MKKCFHSALLRQVHEQDLKGQIVAEQQRSETRCAGATGGRENNSGHRSADELLQTR